MNYTTFKETLMNNLKDAFPNCEFEYHKENDTKESLICKVSVFDQMVAINTTELYQKVMKKGIQSLPYAISVCIEQLQYCLHNLDLDALTDFNKAKDRICCRLIDGNRNPEKMKTAVHLPYLDLQVIFYIPIDRGDNYHTECIIQPNLLKLWNISAVELFTLAKSNIPKLDQPIVLPTSALSLICENIPPILPDEYEPYFVLFPKLKYGNIILLFPEFLEILSQQLDSDLYLVPISETELAIEKTNKPVCCIKESRDSVNVPNEERLGTHIYVYRNGSYQIRIVSESSLDNNQEN